jgi:excisionase family DNA binding protein
MHPNEDAAERLEPLYLSIAQTSRITGLSHVTVYRLIAREELTCVKAGSKSLVEMASIKRYLSSLPRFVGKTGKAA